MKRTKNSSLKFTWNTPEESGMRSPSTTASEPRNYIMNKSFKSFILFAPQNFLFSMTYRQKEKKNITEILAVIIYKNSQVAISIIY